MRLFVNGTEIVVRNRLEVLIDLADEGESLPLNSVITIRGGELRLHGVKDSHGLQVTSDNGISIKGNGKYAGINISRELPPPLTPELQKELKEVLNRDYGGDLITVSSNAHRIFLDLNVASMICNEFRHADEIMKELARKYKFRIIGACPQSLFDGWEFWIECPSLPEWPQYVRNLPWEPLHNE